MTQRKRWLKTCKFEKGECVAVRRPGKVDTDRKRETTTVCLCFGVLVWVYFVHKRFESVINEQDCRDIRTACCCIRSLRIRVEARANVTEREVISRQLQLMHASVQHYRTEDLNTADTSCLSRTSFEHFEDRPGPWAEKNARIPTPR